MKKIDADKLETMICDKYVVSGGHGRMTIHKVAVDIINMVRSLTTDEQPQAVDSQWLEKNGAEYFGYREAGVYEERSTQRIIKLDGQAPKIESVKTEWRRIDTIPAHESDVCLECGGNDIQWYHGGGDVYYRGCNSCGATLNAKGASKMLDYLNGTGKKPDEVEAVLDELTFLFSKEPMHCDLGPYFDGYEDCKGNVLNHIKEIRDKIKKEYEP